MKKIALKKDPRTPPAPYAKDAGTDCATCPDTDTTPPDTDSAGDGIGEPTATVKSRDLDAIAHEPGDSE